MEKKWLHYDWKLNGSCLSPTNKVVIQVWERKSWSGGRSNIDRCSYSDGTFQRVQRQVESVHTSPNNNLDEVSQLDVALFE